MRYFESRERVTTEGTFITYAYGYYSFEIDDGEILAFDEIDKLLLDKYDLKSDQLNGQKFEIFYSIIIDDMDDEDFVILRLDDLIIK
ncbi:hypothetical protein AAON49_01890 [Pseudotenacibaculum sp. MALMAid0570]|uniref:hypothetical protein n=1 Tax=Pseudotenacibaculum sp. MALMAid0570 TaxID=3143938 RepID=UPI0032E01904